MARLLIIGAGGVAGVAVRKCAACPELFEHITLASRTKSKCDAFAADLDRPIETAQIDADDVPKTVELIRRVRPDLVVHLALPYQDLHIMDACLETGVDYLDTANYEPPDVARFEYKWQWAYHDRFAERGIMALLGSGFDPGVTNVFCAYAQKHLFDEIHAIDIVDCNGGDHGHPFATNFNPEINIREVTAKGRYWEDGAWRETEPMAESRSFVFPQIGERRMYLMYHEELESLIRHVPGLKRIRFWMTFGDEYLTHLRVLQNVGMTRIDEIEFEGRAIVPLKLLKALLPDPASLAENYTGKTCIGCVIEGVRDGAPQRVFIHNICDHAACYRQVKAQAVSFTTGVPAMIGAAMMTGGHWRGDGVFHVEQFDPDPFLDLLARHGLPWSITPWDDPV
ncbi:MAG: saccharopine dehydrogenase [Phycisphaeraceae bacterium]|nr:saccharopine dehydrogenase [Phycisphaeraceae bacterium]